MSSKLELFAAARDAADALAAEAGIDAVHTIVTALERKLLAVAETVPIAEPLPYGEVGSQMWPGPTGPVSARYILLAGGGARMIVTTAGGVVMPEGIIIRGTQTTYALYPGEWRAVVLPGGQRKIQVRPLPGRCWRLE